MSKEETEVIMGKTKEETEVDVMGKEEETEVDTMGPTTEETEVDMMGGGKEPEETDVEAELTEAEEEKQPIAGGGGEAGNGDAAAFIIPTVTAGAEKNGTWNVKVPEDEAAAEVKFTGLSKEELMRVAGTPGWVRTRWTLLVLFWLGWLGMLFGAVVIILQAPGCRALPQMSWWSSGSLYQITNIQAFSDTQDLKGVEKMIDSLAKLKVKGLVLGPIHDAPGDDPVSLRFEDISPEVGTLEQFKSVLTAAHRKGISVVLDLTPNYQGTGPWYSNNSVTSVAEKMKSALVFWLNQGVDGVQLLGVEHVASVVPSLWADIRAIIQNATEGDSTSKRVLIGVTEKTTAEDVSNVLSSTGVDLLLSGVLKAGGSNATAQSVQLLRSSHNQNQLAWNVGDRTQGHLASLVGPAMVTFYQLLLLTLPGTPVFSYGDEIGLVDEDTTFPKMLWDTLDPMDELNGTLKEETDQRLNCRSFFSTLSALRDKELSLLYGDFDILFNSSSSMVYQRTWDQSPRYIAVFNWGGAVETVELTEPGLPPQAVVVLSTNGSSLAPATSVDLKALQIGPGEAALLRFPYSSA